jgi:hypothetical protein
LSRFWNGLFETIDVFRRIVDIGLAQYRLADFEALVVHFLVHDVSPLGMAGET